MYQISSTPVVYTHSFETAQSVYDLEKYDKIQFNSISAKILYGGEYVILTEKRYSKNRYSTPTRKVLGRITGSDARLMNEVGGHYASSIITDISSRYGKNRIEIAIGGGNPQTLLSFIQNRDQQNLIAVETKKQEVIKFNSRYLKYLKDRRTVCHGCKKPLSTELNFICLTCKWLRCECGSCGCNYR